MVRGIIFSITALLIVVLVGTMALNSFTAADPTGQAAISITGNTVREIDSPADRLSDDNVRVYEDKVIIYIEQPKWASFTDTNSMDPVLDAEANAIEIEPQSEADIEVGDIIAYTYKEGMVIHRVTEIGEDEEGWYCIVKGDNNPIEDPGKIRFKDVKRVVVGILY